MGKACPPLICLTPRVQICGNTILSGLPSAKKNELNAFKPEVL